MSKLSSQEHMQLYPLIKNPKPFWDGALAASSPESKGIFGGTIYWRNFYGVLCAF